MCILSIKMQYFQSTLSSVLPNGYWNVPFLCHIFTFQKPSSALFSDQIILAHLYQRQTARGPVTMPFPHASKADNPESVAFETRYLGVVKCTYPRRVQTSEGRLNRPSVWKVNRCVCFSITDALVTISCLTFNWECVAVVGNLWRVVWRWRRAIPALLDVIIGPLCVVIVTVCSLVRRNWY